MYTYQYVLRGMGDTTKSMIGSFMQLGAKVIIAVIGAYVINKLDVVWLAWPVSYVAGTIYPYIHYRRFQNSI